MAKKKKRRREMREIPLDKPKPKTKLKPPVAKAKAAAKPQPKPKFKPTVPEPIVHDDCQSSYLRSVYPHQPLNFPKFDGIKRVHIKDSINDMWLEITIDSDTLYFRRDPSAGWLACSNQMVDILRRSLDPMSKRELELFGTLFSEFLQFAEGKLKPQQRVDPTMPKEVLHETMIKLRDAAFKKRSLMDAFVKENPGNHSPEELAVVLQWKHARVGWFYGSSDPRMRGGVEKGGHADSHWSYINRPPGERPACPRAYFTMRSGSAATGM